MSFFSKLKSAKKAADSKKAQEALSKPAAEPYKHIPTHAAIDALGGAPASRNAAERAAIRAAHDKRKSITRNSSAVSAFVSVTPVSPLHSFHKSNSFHGTYHAVGIDQRLSRSQTRFQSVHSLTVHEDSIAKHNQPPSQEIGIATSDNSPSSSDSSYVEIPQRSNARRPEPSPVQANLASSSSSVTINPLLLNAQQYMNNGKRTRALGEAPRLSAPPPLPSPHANSTTKVPSKVQSGTAPAAKRRSWMPFSHARPPPAVLAN